MFSLPWSICRSDLAMLSTLPHCVSGAWDCVAMCFFIDTANNVIGYLERIYAILKPGRHWINLGMYVHRCCLLVYIEQIVYVIF